MRSFHAFTLIELLVVISIIALLSSISVASLNSTRLKARDTRRKADLKTIALALELYFDTNGKYPPAPCGYNCNGYYFSFDATWDAFKTILSPYMSTVPKDPKNEACSPWQGVGAGTNDGCKSYAYGNVTDSTNASYLYHAYDLVTDLENSSDLLACPQTTYNIAFGGGSWCGWEQGIYKGSSTR